MRRQVGLQRPCAANWPALEGGKPVSPGDNYSIVARDDGSRQWPYIGQAALHLRQDQKAGTSAVTGFNRRGGIWRKPDLGLRNTRLRPGLVRAASNPAGYARAPFNRSFANPEGTMLQFSNPLRTAIFGLRLLVAFVAALARGIRA